MEASADARGPISRGLRSRVSGVPCSELIPPILARLRHTTCAPRLVAGGKDSIVSKKSKKISFYLFESRQSFVRSYKTVKNIFVEENIREDYFFFETIELFDRQLLMSSRSSEAIARVEIQVRSTNNLHFRNDDLSKWRSVRSNHANFTSRNDGCSTRDANNAGTGEILSNWRGQKYPIR